ncbi:hypothetical protein [Mesorhizobium sp. KR9-304]|uniref:hypothetical protein n=1 Tax=Mesorhizobium sp. KR9-304 TaxID=3156614 RepID=UPI0032B497D2
MQLTIEVKINLHVPIRNMGGNHIYPGVSHTEKTISPVAAASALRNRQMKRDGLTKGQFRARRIREIERAKKEYKESHERADGVQLEEFVTKHMVQYDQQVVDDLVAYRKFPDKLWAAWKAGTLKLYYENTSSLDSIAHGMREVRGLNSKKEFLQATRLLRLDSTASAIVFDLAKRCRTFFLKADLEMWLANALDGDDDAILQATEALSASLASDQEMPKESAREFVRQNFTNISERRFAGEVWPNAREAVGLARMGRPGPKRKLKLH